MHKRDLLSGTSHLHSVPLPLCVLSMCLYVCVFLCVCVCVCVRERQRVLGGGGGGLLGGSGFEVFLGLVCFPLMLTAGFMGSFSVSPRQHAPLTSTPGQPWVCV